MMVRRTVGQPSAVDSLTITQVKSVIGSQQRQRDTLRTLGLRRMHHSVTQPDRPEIRGMIAKVAHLVQVSYGAGEQPLDLAPGQEPKGAGNPPAGHAVADDEAADREEALHEALAEPGSADAASLVQHPPTLTSTDAPDAPSKPGTPASEEEEPSAVEPQGDET
jgi:large subunit ribosomal protein L30